MGMKDRIKEQRIKAGLTQEELAAKLKLQKSAIAKYENGRVENIKRSVIFEMAKLFGCSPSYLMALDEDDNDQRYYIEEETAQLAQEFFKNPKIRLLFDAARDCSPEDLQMAADLLQRLKGTNR